MEDIQQENNNIKKRGRPKKTDVKMNEVNKREIIEYNNEEIIMELPIEENESEMNIYTIEESEDNIRQERNSEKEEIENITNMNEIIMEMKRKNKIIERLREENEKLKNTSTNNVISITTENKKIIMDLKLIMIENNKSIIVDKTNICCWWCTYNFNTIPCFLPDKYFKEIYYVFGCFCSFSCAKAYNMELMDYRTSVRNNLLQNMYNMIFKNDNIIQSAPKRELLEKFGGIMAISDFRNPLVICTKDIKINIPPIIPLVYEIETTHK